MPALLQLLQAATPAEPDADLLGRFVSTRDGAAFAELVRRHGPAVLGTCRRLVGRTAADDAFQATFLVLAARAGQVRKAASVGSWLVGVAGRVGRRMRAGEQRTEGREQRTEPDQLPAPDSPPDRCLLTSDLCRVLADEFTRLPDRLRAAAVACLLDGRTQEQAAAALGWSSRTVRRRLDAAKELLRERLTRRGVAPAAALTLTAADAVAVPPELARKTTDGATLFLAGGGADVPAAALAHGVIGAMTTIRSTAAAAVCVAALAAVGVGWANDAAPPTEPARIPAPAAKAPPPPAPVEPHVHKTANFRVESPSAALARVVGDEFERQRKAVAVEWLGKELPAWQGPVVVKVREQRDGGYVYHGLTYQFDAVRGAPDGVSHAGPLDAILATEIRAWATRMVLTTHLDRAPPVWAVGYTNQLADAETAGAILTTRRALEAGEALRLSRLFRLTANDRYPVAADQGRTVVQFLLSRTPDLRHSIAEGGSHARTDPAPPLAPGQSAAKRGLLTFFESGGRLTDVYGFASVDALERAWIDWLRTVPVKLPAPPAPDPDRIPPPGEPRAEVEPSGRVFTANFAVTAPSAEVARTVAFAAEKHRRDLAKYWFGRELPDAAEPVTVTVTITAGASGGATTFTFGESDGKRPPGVKAAQMELRGSLDQVRKSVLPHEVMHVVLATHFGRPLPRWADEGMAVLAESAEEQFNHVVRARELLNAGRAIRLSTLFRMTEYPRDSVVTFAQGHSVCRFLLERGGVEPTRGREAALVAFVARGMEENTAASWAAAAQEVYGFASVDALEAAWIESLRAAPRR